jgi:hypothetical protein
LELSGIMPVALLVSLSAALNGEKERVGKSNRKKEVC